MADSVLRSPSSSLTDAPPDTLTGVSAAATLTVTPARSARPSFAVTVRVIRVAPAPTAVTFAVLPLPLTFATPRSSAVHSNFAPEPSPLTRAVSSTDSLSFSVMLP